MNVNPLPEWCTPHEAVGKALTGNGGMGPIHAAPAPFACFVHEEVRLVRDATGAEVVSSTQLHCGFDVVMPPGSLVTVWPGTPASREAEVISTGRSAHETLPAVQIINLT